MSPTSPPQAHIDPALSPVGSRQIRGYRFSVIDFGGFETPESHDRAPPADLSHFVCTIPNLDDFWINSRGPFALRKRRDSGFSPGHSDRGPTCHSQRCRG